MGHLSVHRYKTVLQTGNNTTATTTGRAPQKFNIPVQSHFKILRVSFVGKGDFFCHNQAPQNKNTLSDIKVGPIIAP